MGLSSIKLACYIKEEPMKVIVFVLVAFSLSACAHKIHRETASHNEAQGQGQPSPKRDLAGYFETRGTRR